MPNLHRNNAAEWIMLAIYAPIAWTLRWMHSLGVRAVAHVDFGRQSPGARMS